VSTLLKLNNQELKEMAGTMSDAFLFHSNFKYLIPNQKRRKKALLNLFRMMFKVINRYGYVFVVYNGSSKIGYITYMDENKYTISFLNVLKTFGIRHFIMFMIYSGFRSLLKFHKYMKVYEQFDHTGDNIIHLFSTGIKKEYRGKGLMSKPFKDSFEYFKNLGYSTIRLETSDESNLVVYEKLGFENVSTIKSKKDDQTIYFFDRLL